MWKKRTRGQLAKCAEAQALRKAFPEIGAQPTAEEMEGKTIDLGDAEIVSDSPNSEPKALPEYPDDKFDLNFHEWELLIETGTRTADHIIAKLSTVGTVNEGQIKRLKSVVQVIEEKDRPEPEQPEADLDGPQSDNVDWLT